jgi:hypothetical protein
MVIIRYAGQALLRPEDRDVTFNSPHSTFSLELEYQNE